MTVVKLGDVSSLITLANVRSAAQSSPELLREDCQKSPFPEANDDPSGIASTSSFKMSGTFEQGSQSEFATPPLAEFPLPLACPTAKQTNMVPDISVRSQGISSCTHRSNYGDRQSWVSFGLPPVNDLELQHSSGSLFQRLDMLLHHMQENLVISKAIYKDFSYSEGPKSPKGRRSSRRKSSALKGISTPLNIPIQARRPDPLQSDNEARANTSTILFAPEPVHELGSASINETGNASTGPVHHVSVENSRNYSSVASSGNYSRLSWGFLNSTPRSQSTPDRDQIVAEMRDKMTETTSMKEITRYILDRNSNNSRKAAMVWRFLEDKTSTRAAFAYFYIRGVIVFLSVLLAWLDLVEVSSSFAWLDKQSTGRLQLAIEIMFGLELLVRFGASRDRRSFWFGFYNLIDFVSACPMLLRVWFHFNERLQDSVEMQSIMGIVPVFRLLKVLRYFETFQLLIHSFMMAITVLPVLLFAFFLLSISFAAAIYYFEPRDIIPSVPISLYFVIITVSTVGYGDFSPTTIGGRITTVMLIIAGSLYMAIPIGIVGKAFGDVWEDRHRLLILQRVRRCIECAGYSRYDLAILFEMFDKNGDGMLDLDEFRSLLKMMEVNVSDKLVVIIFQSFEEDNDSLCIDMDSLIHSLFPTSHWIRF